jgi:hypothetical protein
MAGMANLFGVKCQIFPISFENFIACSKEIIFSNKDKNKVTDILCIILLTFLIFFL